MPLHLIVTRKGVSEGRRTDSYEVRELSTSITIVLSGITLANKEICNVRRT